MPRLETLEDRIVPGLISALQYDAGPFPDRGRGPDSVAVASFDSLVNSIPDIVVANGDSNDVGLLLGNGDGTFLPARSFRLDTDPDPQARCIGPSSLAVGNINGDTFPDVVVSCAGNGKVAVLLGDGSGGFQAPIVTDAGPVPLGVAVGHFDADNNLDVVVANFTAGTITVLFGDGTGRFPRRSTIAVTDGSTTMETPLAVTVGDFGNGHDDIAVAGGESLSLIAVFLGNGMGGFDGPHFYPVGSNPHAIALGDVNRDGLPDLVVANTGTSDVTVLLGTGGGAFMDGGSFFAGSAPTSVAIADLNGDGLPDLAVANGDSSDSGNNTLTVMLNDQFNIGTFFIDNSYNAGEHPKSVAVADLNGDGLPDVVIANEGSFPDRGDLSVFVNLGRGVFPTPINTPVGTSPTSVAVGDFNGDGTPDLVVANSQSNTVTVLLGDPMNPGSFMSAIEYDSSDRRPIGCRPPFDECPVPNPRSVAVGHFRSPNVLDIAIVNFGNFPTTPFGSVSILLGNGDGTFKPLWDPTDPTGVMGTHLEFRDLPNDPNPKFFFGIAAGDFSNNGRSDLALMFGSPDGPGIIILQDTGGNDLFTERQVFIREPVTNRPYFFNPKGIAVGDFRGDGRLDLAVADSVPLTGLGALKLLRGNGNGTFQPPIDIQAGIFGSAVAVGDFNGDSKLDIVVANETFPGTVTELLNDGSGNFGATTRIIGVGINPVSVAVADFNNDGNLDLVVANINHTSVSVVLGFGDGFFGPTVHYTAGGFPIAVATAFFSHHETQTFPDIVVLNNTSNNISVLLNDANWPMPPGGSGAASPGPSPAAALGSHFSYRAISQTMPETPRVSLASNDLDTLFALLARPSVGLWQPDGRGSLFNDWFQLVHSRYALVDRTLTAFPWEEV